MGKSHLLTGPKLVLYVNGSPYVPVRSCSYTLDTPVKETRGVDCAAAFQLDPTIVRCSGTLSVYRIARSGGAEGVGAAVAMEDVPNQKYVSLAIVDRATDTVVWSARRCMITSQTWDPEARGLLSGRWTFVGTDWKGEVQPVTRPPQS